MCIIVRPPPHCDGRYLTGLRPQPTPPSDAHDDLINPSARQQQQIRSSSMTRVFVCCRCCYSPPRELLRRPAAGCASSVHLLLLGVPAHYLRPRDTKKFEWRRDEQHVRGWPEAPK